MYSHIKSLFVVFSILISLSASYGVTVKAVTLSGGEEHSMVIDEEGMVWTCGDYSYYQLGHDEDNTVFNLVADGNYDEACDLEDDDSIDVNDLALFCRDWLWDKAWDDDLMLAMGGGFDEMMSMPMTMELSKTQSLTAEPEPVDPNTVYEIIDWLDNELSTGGIYISREKYLDFRNALEKVSK